MPSVEFTGANTKLDDIPLLNGPEAGQRELSEEDGSDSEPHSETESDEDEEGGDPSQDGRHFDNPLWYGKTLDEIRQNTEVAREMGNEASREGDWKGANRCWKDGLKGAQKVRDLELQVRFRLNLALGYIKRGKSPKALEQCDALFTAELFPATSLQQRAKAHYRRAEAHALAGDDAKAESSFKACLDLDPDNSEVLKKLQALKRAALERKQREKSFFKQGAAAAWGAQEQPVSDRATAAEEGAHAGSAKPLQGQTDRSRADRLVRGLESRRSDDELGASALNIECGAPLTVLGPLKSQTSTAAHATTSADSEQ